MNAQTNTTSGSAVEPPRRIEDAIRDSIIASLARFAASVCAMSVGDLCFFALNHANGLSVRQVLGNVFGIVALEAMWNAIGSLAGCLVFLFPVAMLHGRRPIVDRMIPMCLWGALAGVILTGLEIMPFSAWPFEPFGWIFVPFGAIDAVVATATLIHQRRKSSGPISEGD
jgi:hypothetical protein